MTSTNNFDKSSTGTDLECVCFFDTGESQYQFDEAFRIVQSSSYSKNTIAYYICGGQVESDLDIKYKVNGLRTKQIEYLAANSSTWEEQDIAEWSDDEIQAELLSDLNPCVYDLCEHALVETGLTITMNKNVNKLITRGYSQGDYAEVYYCPDDLETLWGAIVQDKDIKPIVNHLFWDCPIYCKVTVNKREFSYDECPAYDEWEFKRVDYAKWIAEQANLSLTDLLAVIPEQPSYN